MDAYLTPVVLQRPSETATAGELGVSARDERDDGGRLYPAGNLPGSASWLLRHACAIRTTTLFFWHLYPQEFFAETVGQNLMITFNHLCTNRR